ncbi:MAG: hypothetical protein CME10_14075 [Gemmatimonadetes bacterium]|nr:hypothetical protein [Gemmatimonadota bacterium]
MCSEIAARMSDAAQEFLAVLDENKRSEVMLDFSDKRERTNWHYIPRDRLGISVKNMDSLQLKCAKKLIQLGVSPKGFEKVETIISLENILGEIEGPTGKFPRDPELYYLSVFGFPGGSQMWGWRFEGHHVSINYTLVDDKIIGPTPLFFGSNPAHVRHGERAGLRALREEEDLGRQLFHELDGSQQRQALISSEAPPDILTTNAPFLSGEVLPEGLSSSQMNTSQCEILEALVDVYVGRLPEVCAEETRSNMQEMGWDNLCFAWAGSGELGQAHYYRIQSQQYLAEYDNTQNDANHIHAVWRDAKNDFGEDALRKHVMKDHP